MAYANKYKFRQLSCIYINCIYLLNLNYYKQYDLINYRKISIQSNIISFDQANNDLG